MSRTAKRFLPLAFVVAARALAIVAIERQHISTRVSPQALLTAAADAQHELTRAPMKLDRMTDADEIALGNALAGEAAATLGAGNANAATEAYLQQVGMRVAAHARRKLPWTFHYIPSPDFVNAFALPGGHVFVGEGLLKLMNSEDALAAVLGHEVEHIDLRHCAERAQAEARLHQLGTLGDLIGLPAELFMAGYSKDEELEADRDGTTLAVQSGYSYAGIILLFDKFRVLKADEAHESNKPNGPLDEVAQISLSTVSGYLASHPPSDLRAERISELAGERGWRSQPLRCSLQSGALSKLGCQPNQIGPK